MATFGGAFQALPAATAVGSQLSRGFEGVELTLTPGASVTYTVAASQPTSAPALTRTVSNPNGATTYLADVIFLASGNLVYVTAVTGTAFYRTF